MWENRTWTRQVPSRFSICDMALLAMVRNRKTSNSLFLLGEKMSCEGSLCGSERVMLRWQRCVNVKDVALATEHSDDCLQQSSTPPNNSWTGQATVPNGAQLNQPVKDKKTANYNDSSQKSVHLVANVVFWLTARNGPTAQAHQTDR